MQVSNTTDQYQALQTQQQKPVTTSVEPKDPTYSNKEVYEASQGNLVRGNEGVELTPQGQNKIDNKEAANTAEQAAATQTLQDEQRGTATDYLAHKSKQSQVEIYLAVATDGKSEAKDSTTADVVSELRNVQKQNNAVAAYATYQGNQAQGNPALY